MITEKPPKIHLQIYLQSISQIFLQYLLQSKYGCEYFDF